VSRQSFEEEVGMDPEQLDVIVVGAGPAGLSAALLLGRACRRVAVFDDGRPRNAMSPAVHGFLSRDGTPPAELLGTARNQLSAYPNVRLFDERVVDATRDESGFEVVAQGGRRARGRKLILATGLTDQLPTVRGMRELYGKGVYSCPYCDGWEVRDRRLASYGHTDAHGGELALELTVWSRDVVLCTDGHSQLSEAMLGLLERNGVRVRHERIVELAGAQGRLSSVVFENRPPLERDALFVFSNPREASDLAARVGSSAWTETNVAVERHGRADVPGLYVIGDASRDVLQVSVAAAEGTSAAICANTDLLREDTR
jgi:thioredoxin reductase